MDWLAFVANIINRVPIEKVIIPQPDHTKALEEFAGSVTAPQTAIKAPPEQKTTPTTQPAEKSPEIEPQAAPKVHLAEPQPGGLSTEVTVDYQNRELGKLLLRMERHYAQKLRIAGVPCDCGSQKHLLDIESLCEETIPMIDNPQVYYRITKWVKGVGPKSTDEAAKSGLHDEEYPTFSHQARDFRKEIIGSLEPAALFPQKAGEPEGTQILPVVSEEEKEQIREKAHEKVEQVLGQEESHSGQSISPTNLKRLREATTKVRKADYSLESMAERKKLLDEIVNGEQRMMAIYLFDANHWLEKVGEACDEAKEVPSSEFESYEGIALSHLDESLSYYNTCYRNGWITEAEFKDMEKYFNELVVFIENHDWEKACGRTGDADRLAKIILADRLRGKKGAIQ